MFFDDILVYNPTVEFHQQLLYKVFQLMRIHSLVAKSSKCHFGLEKVDYLGHFISGKRVEVDIAKISFIIHWLVPQTIRNLRSFLGVAGYYRKFIARYAWLSKPLTQLLKNESFAWFDEAQEAFETPSVLALPDFSKVSIVETDASQKGIGAVLMQEGQPLAYLSKSLGFK